MSSELVLNTLGVHGGRWNRYPAYKDSGVEWIGEVPDHWKTIRLKYAFILMRGFDLASDKFIDGCYPVRGSNGTIGYHDEYTTVGPSITVGRSGSVGEVHYIESNFWAHNTSLYVKYFKEACPKFSYYLLKTLDLKSLSAGSAVGTLNRNYIHDLPITIPNYSEQRAIAAFLDHETGRIDTLIKKKERQIKLLQEKRAALISHAVIKGLDPDVKMKDSGVEWLGEVPEGWIVKRFSFLFQFLDNYRIPVAGEDRAAMAKTFPYYGASGIIDYVDDYIFDETLILVAEDGANLLSRSTPLAFIAGGKYWVNNHAHILRPINGQLLFWEGVLQIYDYSPLITGAAQPKLTKENLGSILLPCPPIDEQKAIAIYINAETGRIDILSNKVRESISKLREYRTALISAAVTGKIDVRQEAA